MVTPPLEGHTSHQWEAVHMNVARKGLSVWTAVGMQLTRELSKATPQEQTVHCFSQYVHTHNTHCYYDILNALLICVWSVWILSTSFRAVWSMHVYNNCKRRHFFRVAPQCFAFTRLFTLQVVLVYCCNFIHLWNLESIVVIFHLRYVWWC